MPRFGRFFELLNMSCERASRLSSEDLDRRLTRGERLALGFHTLYCSACRRFRRQLAFLHRAAGRLPSAPDPTTHTPALPPTARERILRAMKKPE